MSVSDATALITSRDPKISVFGTGFVIHRNAEEQASYLLTCAHVIRDVGGPEKINVANQPATIVAYGDPDGKGVDLAVLRVEGLMELPCLSIQEGAVQGDKVLVTGFQLFKPGYLLRSIKGTLGQEVELASTGTTAERVIAWDLIIEGEFKLERGYSGSPVAREGNNSVLGVVSNRMGEGQKGIAISISALKSILTENSIESSISSQLSRALRLSLLSPAQADPLIGREDQINLLTTRLRQGRDIALSGLPGVGKTSLALNLANSPDLHAHFHDGILWASLGRRPDIFKLLGDWATTLGFPPDQVAHLDSVESRRLAIRTAIAARSMLLVVDDAWDVVSALNFKLGGYASAHVVTTRRAEVALEFTDDSPDAIREAVVHELNEEQGMQLMRRLAADAVQSEPEKARALVQAVGGLPLALTIMGKYLRKESYSRQPRRIQEALGRLLEAKGRLSIAQAVTAEQHYLNLKENIPMSLLAVIGVSDETLDPEAQATLRTLSAFPSKPNHFSEEAALAVTGLPASNLNVLTDQGLLQTTSSGRYTLPQTIADYALSQRTDEGSSERMALFFAEYADKYRADYIAIEQEYANLIAALNGCYLRGQKAEETAARQKYWQLFGKFVSDMADFWFARGYWRERIEFCLRAYTTCTVIEDWEGAGLQAYAIGWVYTEQSNLNQAQAWAQKCLSAMTISASSEGLSLAQHLQGLVAMQQGDYSRAGECFLEALGSVSAKRAGVGGKGSIMSELGHLHRCQNKFPEACTWYEQCIAENERTGFIEGLGISKGYLAITLYCIGKQERAEKLYREALAIAQQVGRATTVARIHSGLAELLYARGDLEEAKQHIVEALPIYNRLNKHDAALRMAALLTKISEDHAGKDELGHIGIDEHTK